MAQTVDQIEFEYPLPSYRFVVSIGEDKISFNNVSGLDIKYGLIEYRDGIGNYFKMPGLAESVNITLRKGLFRGPNALYDWISTISLNKVEKRDVMISLTDESGGKLFITWSIADAFPISLTAPTFDAGSNEVSLQEVNLVADRVTVQMH